MDRIVQLMMKLIASELCFCPLNKEKFKGLTEEDFASLYKLSEMHDLAHIVGYALDKNKLIPSESQYADKFQNKIFTAVMRYENNDCELNKIKETLEKSEIPFVALKGSVIKKFYPEPWMRTSCDIDILVHEEDLERAEKALVEQLDYTTDGKISSHDLSMFSQGNVHLELHYRLIEDELLDEATSILKNAFDYAELQKGFKYSYVFRDEFFYMYHIWHMSKHVKNGGCGVRPFMDLWLMENVIGHNNDARNKLLEKVKLSTFTNVARKLVKVWFSNEKSDEITEKLQNYLIFGGVYGTQKNHVELQSVKKGNKFKYLMSRIFLKYDIIKYHYPVLFRHKWLLPFCEVRRWCKLFFCGGLKRSISEIKTTVSVTDEKKSEMQDFISKIGL